MEIKKNKNKSLETVLSKIKSSVITGGTYIEQNISFYEIENSKNIRLIDFENYMKSQSLQ